MRYAGRIGKAGVIVLMASALSLSAVSRGEEITVPKCKTSFVDRVRFSVDRVGVIAFVPKEGDHVQAGDTVVRLKDEVPQAALAVAQAKADNDADIRSAEKMAQASALEYEAAVEANRRAGTSVDAYPPTHVARLLLNSESYALKVKQAEHEKRVNQLTARQVQAELDTYHAISDISGIVTEVLKHVGEGVQQGEAIIQVVNTDRMRVEGYVSIENSFRIKPGMPVKVTLNLPASAGTLATHEFTGKLGYIDVSVHTLSDRVRVWAEIENLSGQLREGLEATMVILASPPESAAAAGK